MARRFTPAQKRVLSIVSAGGIVRRRGAFGGGQAPPGDARFAAGVTLDILQREGLVRPAPWWGAFEGTDKAAAPNGED